MAHHVAAHGSSAPGRGIIGWYRATPLYLRILVALVLGACAGWALGPEAEAFKLLSEIVLRLLGALATPLIFVAVLHALLTADVRGRDGLRLAVLLLGNTVVAILVGLAVANVVQPGRWVQLKAPNPEATAAAAPGKLATGFDARKHVLERFPGSVVRPFAENDIMAVILIALAFGIALRIERGRRRTDEREAFRILATLLELAYRAVMVLLHGIFHLVPVAVFAVVAALVGKQGLTGLLPLASFVVAVLVALAVQSVYYLIRLRFGSWVRPWRFLRDSSDALMTAFSTASSAATLPITYACAKDKIGVREESASLGVMVGGTFNHDGTALYEAMAALFISQALGNPLDFTQQLIVVVMAVFASVGAAGIPEAGLVTMMAVFSAVGLPIEYIPLLLTVDWFLDRCRTAINVMGDLCVTCLLDGRQPAPTSPSGDVTVAALRTPVTEGIAAPE